MRADTLMPTVAEDRLGVSFVLDVEGLGPQPFLVTRQALCERFGAMPTPEGMLACFSANAVHMVAAAQMKLQVALGDVAVLDTRDFP